MIYESEIVESSSSSVVTDFMSGRDSNENSKRKKLSGDERLHRNRERNRMHARKTRERKKNQSNALQTRLTELQEEGVKLRQIVDERYTASVLLGLCQTVKNPDSGENIKVLSSASICENAFSIAMAENSFLGENNIVGGLGAGLGGGMMSPIAGMDKKRTRRRGKYTPQDRERIRRERNRMHAKKTRDRKKELLEISEVVIIKMEKESFLLREYLVSLRLLSVEEAERLEVRARESSKELAALKASPGEYDLDGDDDDDNFDDENIEGDDGNEPDGSLSGSDELEKESCDGSLEGETSSDGNASSSSKTSSSSNSGSGNDSTELTSTDTNSWDKMHYKNRNNNVNPIENKSQSIESYNHSGLNLDFKENCESIPISFSQNECDDVKTKNTPRPISSTFLSKSSMLPSNFNNNDFINDDNEKINENNKRNSNYNINKDSNTYNEKKIDFLVQKTTVKKSTSSNNLNFNIDINKSSIPEENETIHNKNHSNKIQNCSQSNNSKIIANKNPKISNIIIPIIPQGILHPREPGGISPQGMKTSYTPSENPSSFTSNHITGVSCTNQNGNVLQDMTESWRQKLLYINNKQQIESRVNDNITDGNNFYPYYLNNGEVTYRHLPSSSIYDSCIAL